MNHDPAEVGRLMLQIMRLGSRRAHARDELEATSAALPDLARRAMAAGVPKTEICLHAEVSRPTLDAMLKEGQDS